MSGIYGAAVFSEGIGFRRAQLMSQALVEYAITFAWFRLNPELHMAQ